MHVRQARDIVRLGSADVGSDRAAEKDYVGIVASCGIMWYRSSGYFGPRLAHERYFIQLLISNNKHPPTLLQRTHSLGWVSSEKQNRKRCKSE